MNDEENTAIGCVALLLVGIGLIWMISSCTKSETPKQEIQQTNQGVVSYSERSETERFNSLLEELKNYARSNLNYALALESFANSEIKGEMEKLRKENEELRTEIGKLKKGQNHLTCSVSQLTTTQLNGANELIKEKEPLERDNRELRGLIYQSMQQKSQESPFVPVWLGSKDNKITYFKIINLETEEFFFYDLQESWRHGRIIGLPPGKYRVEVTKFVQQGLTRRLLMTFSRLCKVYEKPIVEIEGRKVHASLVF